AAGEAMRSAASAIDLFITRNPLAEREGETIAPRKSWPPGCQAHPYTAGDKAGIASVPPRSNQEDFHEIRIARRGRGVGSCRVRGDGGTIFVANDRRHADELSEHQVQHLRRAHDRQDRYTRREPAGAFNGDMHDPRRSRYRLGNDAPRV